MKKKETAKAREEDLVQKRFREKLGLIIDKPRQVSGNTNDGNTARSFFTMQVALLKSLEVKKLEWMKISLEWMKISLEWMKISLEWMKISLEWMKISLEWMKI